MRTKTSVGASTSRTATERSPTTQKFFRRTINPNRRSMKRSILTLLTLTLLIPSARPAAPEATSEIRPRISSSELQLFPYYEIKKSDDLRSELHLIVAFFNKGSEPLILPTHGSHFSARDQSVREGRRRVIEQHVFIDEFLNVKNIPSREGFLPVVLLPGDVTVVEFDVDVSRDWSLVNVEFEYRVWDEMGKRYGFWTGAAMANLLEWTSENRNKFYRMFKKK